MTFYNFAPIYTRTSSGSGCLSHHTFNGITYSHFKHSFLICQWQILSHCIELYFLEYEEIEKKFILYLYCLYVIDIFYVLCTFLWKFAFFYWFRGVLCILSVLAFWYIYYKHFHLSFKYLYLKRFALYVVKYIRFFKSFLVLVFGTGWFFWELLADYFFPFSLIYNFSFIETEFSFPLII